MCLSNFINLQVVEKRYFNLVKLLHMETGYEIKLNLVGLPKTENDTLYVIIKIERCCLNNQDYY